MSSLVRNERKSAEARAHIDQEQLRKWDVEKGQIGVSVRTLPIQMRILLIMID